MIKAVRRPGTLSLLITLFVLFALSIASLGIPFFWDSVTFSKIANFFYFSGANGFIVPAESDTGGFPLYGAYIAFGWKLFGRTLAVSHLMFLPFILGCAWEYYKLCQKFLKEEMIPYAMLLMLAEPCFITQGMLMAYDIIILYFFLLAINSLLKNRFFWYSAAILCIALISVRGAICVGSLLIVHIVIYRQKTNETYSAKMFLAYIPAAVICIVWLLYHRWHVGWMLFSPLREKTDEHLVEPAMIGRQFMYIIWKIADFGRIVLWVFLIIVAIKRLLQKNIREVVGFKKLLLILLITLAVNMIIMSVISNPIGHRYFLITFALLNITVLILVGHIKSKVTKVLITGFFLLAMLIGNFILYPQRFGNGWDCSLKVLPFFDMEKKLQAFIIDNGINPSTVFTDFPLQASPNNTFLLSDSEGFRDISCLNLKAPGGYILVSNISNRFHPETINKIKRDCIRIYFDCNHQIYIALYKVPE